MKRRLALGLLLSFYRALGAPGAAAAASLAAVTRAFAASTWASFFGVGG